MFDTFSSFLDNIKQKTTNPLLGTMLAVAIVKYWEVIFAIFSFDDDCDMLYKQTYISNYFAEKKVGHEIWYIAWRSFVLLIVTYLLLSLSKVLLEFYEKHIIKRIIQYTDRNSVKTLLEYQTLEKSTEEVFEQLKKQRAENESLEKRIGAFKEDLVNQQTIITEANIKIGQLEQVVKDSETAVLHKKEELEQVKAELAEEAEKNKNLNDELEKFKGQDIVQSKRSAMDIFYLSPDISWDDFPEHLQLQHNKEAIIEQAGYFKDQPIFKTFAKRQREAILKIEEQLKIFDFIYYVEYIQSPLNADYYLALERISQYTDGGLMYINSDIKRDEEKAGKISTTLEGTKYYKFLTENIFPF